MAHVRAQIREYVRSLLITIEGLEQHVTIDSEDIPEDLDLPWVHVQVGQEDTDARGLGGPQGRKLQRELQLTVDIYCRDKRELFAQAEDYATEIETKLAAEPRMNGLASDLRLRAITPSRSSEGDQPIIQLRLLWFVTYFTNERDPTVPA